MNKTSKHTHREKPRIKQFIDIRGLMEVLATSVEYAELLNLQHRYNMCFSLSDQVVHVHIGKEGSQFKYKLKMRHTCLTQQEGGYFLIIGIKALI